MARKGEQTPDGDGDVIYELDIDEHVPYIDPADYGIDDESIKPKDYFITSGDAVVKAEHLNDDMWEFAGKMRKKYSSSKNKKHQEYSDQLWKCAGRCRSLLNLLKKVRGDAIFLELEWRDHVLYCIPKNPRKKE